MATKKPCILGFKASIDYSLTVYQDLCYWSIGSHSGWRYILKCALKYNVVRLLKSALYSSIRSHCSIVLRYMPRVYIN